MCSEWPSGNCQTKSETFRWMGSLRPPWAKNYKLLKQFGSKKQLIVTNIRSLLCNVTKVPKGYDQFWCEYNERYQQEPSDLSSYNNFLTIPFSRVCQCNNYHRTTANFFPQRVINGGHQYKSSVGNSWVLPGQTLHPPDQNNKSNFSIVASILEN